MRLEGIASRTGVWPAAPAADVSTAADVPASTRPPQQDYPDLTEKAPPDKTEAPEKKPDAKPRKGPSQGGGMEL